MKMNKRKQLFSLRRLIIQQGMDGLSEMRQMMLKKLSSIKMQIMKKRINLQHAKNGVSIMDLTHTYITPEVEIEGDVVIYPGTMLTGNTTVKSGAIIGPHSEIDNSTIGKDTVIRQSIVINSKIGD